VSRRLAAVQRRSRGKGPFDMNTEIARYSPAIPDETASGEEGVEREFLSLLDQVFRRLRQHNIRHCVLRNRDRIPRGLLTGSDVDVLVPAGTLASELVRIMGDLRPTHVVPHRSTLEVYFPAGPLLLHVDFLIQDREWRGARYLRNEEILDAARDDDGMPVASPVHQAFCAWFSSLTRRGKFKPRYVPLISSAFRDSPDAMARLLTRAFGRRLALELLGLAERGELQRSDEFAGRCRRAIWLRALRRQPLATLWGLAAHYAAEARLWARPPGLSVAVLGPDGSGKSAVASALTSATRAVLPFTAVSVHHLYERVLPRLSELKKGRLRRRPSAPAVVHNPHGKTAHTALGSLFTLGYSMLDQWLSQFLFVRSRLGRNTLLCHDRYMIEIVVDPKRFRYGGPQWLARAFSRITPRLDLVVLLDAPAEVLQSRKQEVEFKETKRQREAYRALVSALPNGHVVDANRPLPPVVEDVRRILLLYLAHRTAHRFRFAVAGAATSGVSTSGAKLSSPAAPAGAAPAAVAPATAVPFEVCR